MRIGKNAACHHSQPDGFALVVTVSLMILLAVIAMGLLGLSAITLRSGSREQARMEAQANDGDGMDTASRPVGRWVDQREPWKYGLMMPPNTHPLEE